MSREINDLSLKSGITTAYGNSSGQGILETLAQHDDRVVELQTKVGYLEAEVSNLIDASHGTFEIRRRFYDVYKRNKGNTAYENTEAIKIGNALTHRGNALKDAEMFEKDRRGDHSTYRELYGLDHTQVQQFSKYNIIKRIGKRMIHLLRMSAGAPTTNNCFCTETSAEGPRAR